MVDKTTTQREGGYIGRAPWSIARTDAVSVVMTTMLEKQMMFMLLLMVDIMVTKEAALFITNIMTYNYRSWR